MGYLVQLLLLKLYHWGISMNSPSLFLFVLEKLKLRLAIDHYSLSQFFSLLPLSLNFYLRSLISLLSLYFYLSPTHFTKKKINSPFSSHYHGIIIFKIHPQISLSLAQHPHPHGLNQLLCRFKWCKYLCQLFYQTKRAWRPIKTHTNKHKYEQVLS